MLPNPPSTKFLPIYREKPVARPVDPEWHCHQSGDCCTMTDEVVMTKEERIALLPHVPEGIKTLWRDLDPEGKFVALKAHPCPFFIFKTCLVYAYRPYNCRRFACMRPDPKTEPYEIDTTPGSITACKNADDRFRTSREARRLMIRIQRKAGKWARAHGWVEK